MIAEDLEMFTQVVDDDLSKTPPPANGRSKFETADGQELCLVARSQEEEGTGEAEGGNGRQEG